ncbi:MAG: filamentous hemagglutinin N-terminal domain-containing protein [Phycisphaerales bacterium]
MRARDLMRAAGRAIGCRGAIGAAVLAGGAAHALAGPEGEDVQYGWAEFYRDGVLTYIYVSDLAIIQYDAFNIESWETVRFIQPSEMSRVLNRIDGAMPTFINGTLEANGQVFFVNPAGIYFGGGSVIDVGGIYAAAGHISNNDFLSGVNNFTGLQGEVVNQGTIKSSGSVALLGRRVANFGQVIADDVVTMAAGDEVLIGERDGHVFARVTGIGEYNGGGPATLVGVENSGVIRAGNQVVLGVGDQFALALFDTSEIYAQAVDISGKNGSHISVAGKIDVTGDTGGRVHILGDYIEIDNAIIDASGLNGGGTIRIGGGYQGSGSLWRAKGTWIGQNALLRADAINQGDGGAVIVWADGATGFAGTISAKGGAFGGNGGFTEVSGKGWLSFGGRVDLTAAFGHKGTLLLDPTNIRIFDGPAGSGDVNSSATNADFIFGAADADPGDMETSIANADIVTLLDTTDLVLQANNDILIEGSIDASGNAGDHSLSLNAGRSVVISDNVSILLRGAFSATVNDVNAGVDRGAGAGVFTMGANSVIRTTYGASDGAITIESQDGRTGAELSGDFTLGTLDAGTATISLTVTGDDGSASFLAATGGAFLTGGAVELNNALVGGDMGTSGALLSITSPMFAAATSGDAFLAFSGATTIDTVGGTTGVSSSGGSLSLISSDLITIDEAVSVTGTNIVSINAGDLDIGATGSITGGSTGVFITSSNDVELGVASGAGGVMVLDNAELSRISGGALFIGLGSLIPSIRVEGVDGAALGGDVFAGLGGGLVSLSAAVVTFEGAASVFTNLSVTATTSATIDTDLTTELGGLTVTTPALDIGGGLMVSSAGTLMLSGPITLTGAGGTVTLASGDGFGVTTGSVTSSMGSSLTINSGAGVTTGAVNLGAGDLVANVDQGADDSTTSSFGAITAGSVSVTASNAATLNLNGLVTTSAGGVTVDALAGGTINVITGGINATGGDIDLTAMTTTLLAALTSNTGGISVTGNLSIGQGLTLNAAGGAIGVTGGVSLTGSGGTVTLTSADGFGVSTGSITSTMNSSLTINSGDAITAGAISLGSGALLANVDQGADGTTSSVFGAITAGSVSVLAANDATLDFNGLITSTAGAVSLNSGAGGAININAGGINATGGAVTLTGSTKLLADIVSAGESIVFVGDLTLGGGSTRSLTITGGGAGDLIDFQGSLFAMASEGLTLNAGTGSVNFGDASGDGVGQGGMALGDVLITNANTVTVNAALFTAESFSAGVGGTVGTVDFNAPAGLVTLTGANASGNALEVDASTLITLAHAVTSTGAGAKVLLTGPVHLNNDIQTNSGSITFVDDVLLGGTGTRLLTINSGNAGDLIDFQGDLDAAAGQSLTLNAGTGDVAFGDNATLDGHGLSGALGDVLVTDATLVTINGSMTANSLSIGQGGTVGTATLNVGTSTLTLLGASGSGYAVFIDVGTLATLNGNIDSQAMGAHVNFDGPLNLNGNIQVNAADIGFNGDVLLGGGGTRLITILNAGMSDSVLFAEDLDSAAGEGLTLDVGIGAIAFGDSGTDQIGFVGELGDILVLNAGLVDVSGAMRANSFTAGTMGTVGSVNFADAPGTLVSVFSGQNAAGYALQLATTNGVNLSQSIGATSMAAGGGAIDIDAGAGTITSTDDFDIETTGSLTLHSDVVATDNILVTLDAGGLGGMTGTFQGLDGGNVLVISTGGPLSLTFNGAINSAGAVGVMLDAMSAGSLTFNAGSSITTTGGTLAGEGSVSLTGGVTLATNLTIDTSAAGASGGNITIFNAVNGDAAGTRALNLQAGDGTVTVASIGDVNRLDSLTIDAGGGNINFRGLTYAAESQNYNANLFFVDTLSAPASVLFTGNASQAGDIIFTGGSMTLAAMHDVTFNAPNGNVTLVPIFGGPTNSFYLTSSGTATIAGLGTNVNPFDAIDITATEINLTGMIYGNGQLGLHPFSAGQNVEIAGASDSGGGVLDLTAADLAMLGDGFSSIFIGRTDGTGAFGIHGFTFLDSVAFDTSGNILIDGLLATSGAGDSITLGDSVAQSSLITLDVGGATITTNNGDVTAYGSLRLAQTSTISTGAGAGNLMVTGVTNAMGAGVQGLTVTAGTGSIDMNTIGATTALASLSLMGGNIDLNGIGTAIAQGVTGLVGVTASGLVTLDGVSYNAAQHMWTATGGYLAASDVDFLASTGVGVNIAGGDFTLAGNSFSAITSGQDVMISSAFVGSGMIGETFLVNANGGAVSLASLGSSGARLASVEVRGATISLHDVYTLEQVGASGDQTFVGDLTLASTYDSMGGDILFDGDVLGLSTVVADAAGGTITFTGTNLSAPVWDLTAAFYDFTGSPSVFMEATGGNLTFNGGQIRLMGPSDITFEALFGTSDITLANIWGNGTEDLIATATGTIFTNGAGSSAATGVDTTTFTAEEIDFSGADFWTNFATLAPYMAGTDVNVAMGVSGTSLDLTAAELNSLKGLDELYIGRLDGTGLMSVGALTLSSYLELQMQGVGGGIELWGPLTITGGNDVYFRSDDPMVLGGAVTTQGGDFFCDTNILVTGTASITTGGGDINLHYAFDGLTDGDGDLSIDYGSGTINFLDTPYGYGFINRLNTLHVTGDLITLHFARTAGSQTFSGVTMLDDGLGGAVVDALDGPITFEDDVYVQGLAQITMGGVHQTTFMGDVFGMNTGADILHVDAGASGTVRFEGNIGTTSKELESLFIDDAVATTFLGNVYVDDQLDITGDAVLDASGDPDHVLVFCGNDVTFRNALYSSVQGASGIDVWASGLTTFMGPVGDGAGRLRSIATDAPGTTIIADDISTQFGMTFGDDVLIAGTPTLRTYDTGVAGSIYFWKTVNADGNPGRTLTVLTDLTSIGLVGGVPNPNVPIIHFVGDIGTGVGGQLAELNLNYSLSLGIDGHIDVPVGATIVLGDAAAFLGSGTMRDFTLNVQTLNMGFNEKIGVPGALHLTATLAARLGDITAAGDLFVTTPSLTILTRVPGQVYDPITGMAAFDDGVDFISGGTQIVFTTGSITLEGSGDDPSFAVSGGNVTVSEPFEIRSFSEQVSALMSGVIVLDVRSLGPTNTNVAEAIAAAVPRESQSGTISEDTTVGLAAQEVLRELGIYPRASLTDPHLTDAERTALLEAVLEAMLGMAVYNDLPGAAEPEYTEVTVDRLELELVDDILAEYRSLFRVERVDPETGETIVEDRRAHIRDTLSAAVILYFETLDTDEFDPEQFMAFLQEHGEQTSEALGYVTELRRLFGRIRLLGLSSREVAGVKSALFGAVRPGDLTTSQIEALLDPSSAPAASK